MLVFEIVKSKWIRETTSQCEYITNRFYLHNVANFLKIIVIRTYQIYQSYKIKFKLQTKKDTSSNTRNASRYLSRIDGNVNRNEERPEKKGKVQQVH